MALRTGLARFGRHLHRGAAAYGVLLIALLLTLLAYYYVRQNVEAEARTRFDETTQATKAAIYRRVKGNLDATRHPARCSTTRMAWRTLGRRRIQLSSPQKDESK
jgi:hypothetical protein